MGHCSILSSQLHPWCHNKYSTPKYNGSSHTRLNSLLGHLLVLFPFAQDIYFKQYIYIFSKINHLRFRICITFFKKQPLFFSHLDFMLLSCPSASCNYKITTLRQLSVSLYFLNYKLVVLKYSKHAFRTRLKRLSSSSSSSKHTLSFMDHCLVMVQQLA